MIEDSNKAENNTDINAEDRRQQTRYPLRAYAQMQYSTKQWDANVLDISASGARLAILGEHLLRKGDALRVQILLDPESNSNQNKMLRLHGRLAHVREHILGFDFQPDTPADKKLLDRLLEDINHYG